MANTIGQRLGDLARSRTAVVALAWLAALVASGLLYLWTPQFAGVPGQVEVVDFNVAAPEPLRIVALPVEVGTPVRKGDVVAALDPVPLTLEREVVRAELDLRTAEVRFRQVTDERAFAQGVAGAEAALALENVNATRVAADLQAVRRRLAWWKTQVAAGTAPGRDVEDLATQEAALVRRLGSHRDAIAALAAQGKAGRERLAAWRQSTGAPPERAGVGDGFPQETLAGAEADSGRSRKLPATDAEGEADPARAAMRVAQARLALLDSRLQDLTLRAPADGVVQRVSARPGDVSQAGQTVVLIREDVPRRVFAYPSASQAALLRVGTRAWVAPRDTGGSDRFPAHVVAIGPGLVPYPDALQNRTSAINAWGQAVILRLDGPTPLAPGQVVDVSLLKVDEPMLRDPEAATPPSP
jgi:HlyD family secretion protein